MSKQYLLRWEKKEGSLGEKSFLWIKVEKTVSWEAVRAAQPGSRETRMHAAGHVRAPRGWRPRACSGNPVPDLGKGLYEHPKTSRTVRVGATLIICYSNYLQLGFKVSVTRIICDPAQDDYL